MFEKFLAPGNLGEVADQFKRDMIGIFGKDLVSIVLYGSAASAEYKRGISDINFVLILKKIDHESLKKASVRLSWWRRSWVSAPLLFTEEELEDAADVFPLEFLSIKQNHKLIHGKDPFPGLQISKADVRKQLEFELRSKLIHLRQSYLEVRRNRESLKALAASTVAALSPLAEGLLFLKEIKSPPAKKSMLESLGKAYRIDVNPLVLAYGIKYEDANPSNDELESLIKSMLISLRALAEAVDKIEVRK
ncbi:hypothetical protein H0O01_04190 [Candidatus Micrarchaeota archaeon]|nr:hypothetical protein [Candidatus Micrarchaeota archaeon]